MIRFLIACVIAMAQFVANCASEFAKAFDAVLDAIKRLFGGGAGGPAAPVNDIIGALPDADKLTDKIAELRNEQAAEEAAPDNTPVAQARMYALEPAETRHKRDLDLLSSDQRLWLLDLTEDQLSTLGNAKAAHIEDALKGMPLAIGGIMSVGYTHPAMVAPTLHRRIEAHRSALRELNNVPAM